MRIIFSINDARAGGERAKELSWTPTSHHFTKTDSKWMKDLNVQM